MTSSLDFETLRLRVSEEVSQFLKTVDRHDREPANYRSLKAQLAEHLVTIHGSRPLPNEDNRYSDEASYSMDFGTVSLFNRLHIDAIRLVPIAARALFLPHCLQSRKKCSAEEFTSFSRCARCGACSVEWLTEYAETLGYQRERMFVVSGGSVVRGLIAKSHAKGVIGVACYAELAAYIESHNSDGGLVPTQMIMLSKWGCRDTSFDRAHAIQVLTDAAFGVPRA
ncbi:MAG: DUF116 domain-containing protein [Candidatus Brocadiia bacterium]